MESNLTGFVESIYDAGEPWRILMAVSVLFGIPLLLFYMFGPVGFWLAVLIFVAFMARGAWNF